MSQYTYDIVVFLENGQFNAGYFGRQKDASVDTRYAGTDDCDPDLSYMIDAAGRIQLQFRRWIWGWRGSLISSLFNAS